MLLHPTPARTSQFTYDPRTYTFVAELSDLGRPLGRVWDDACDVGLTLVSARTGREIVFAVAAEERDREGELLWLDLTPAQPNGSTRHLRVRLYND